MNIGRNLEAYLGNRGPNNRYASFDYCFNYFQSARQAGQLSRLVSASNIELSCLQLGFFLASWGMFRGSTALLQRSSRYYEPLIAYIATVRSNIWDVDANSYTDEAIELIFQTQREVARCMPDEASDVLISKIMLGVFGCVPAFDTRFVKGFRGTFSKRSLRRIGDFYDQHREVIEANRVTTLGFQRGTTTKRRYPRAKVIDMIFFIEGGGTPDSK